MAEGERHRKHYGQFSLKRAGSAPVSTFRHNKEKGKVEKVTEDALASCEKCTNNDSSYLWANAARRKSQSTPADKSMCNVNSSPSKKSNYNLKDNNDNVCYELKKGSLNKSNLKISSWPQCSTYHPCRGSDPNALLDNSQSVPPRKSSDSKSISSKNKHKEEVKSKSKDSNVKLERPSSLAKKTMSKDVDFAHVVPPPPAPIPFKFVHHDDPLLYASDYRLQYTYDKIHSMQKSVKARQAQSRAKIFSMDSRAVGQSHLGKNVKQSLTSINRKISIGEISDRLKSPESENVGSSHVKRSSSSLSGKKLYGISCVQLKLEQQAIDVSSSQKHRTENCPKYSLQPKEQNRYESVSFMKRDSKSMQYFHQRQSLDAFDTRKSQSCLTWPQNSFSRKSENNHKNIMAAKQQKRFQTNIIGESQAVSLPSSPKKIASIKSKKTLTPPLTRRHKFL